MILRFFARLGCEFSLYSQCERITYPDDYLWAGFVMLFAMYLTCKLKGA